MRFVLFLTILVSTTVFANDERQKVVEFSGNIKRIITDSDSKAFAKLRVHPSTNTISDVALKMIFGKKNEVTNFERVMSNPSLKIKADNPYSYDGNSTKNIYTVHFYTLENSPFLENGFISHKACDEDLYKTYFQTEIKIENGVVGFNYVPFYIEAHHPCVDDYG